MTIFKHRLQQLMARGKRDSSQNSALIIFELNPDSELDPILEELLHITRCEDTVAILSSNHLGVIISEFSHPSDPLRIVKRFQKSCENLSKSIVLTGLENFESSDALLEKGFHSLSQIPDLEFSRFENSEEEILASDRLKLEQELESAVLEDKLQVYYQPIYNLAQGVLTGFEALVRWEHPQRGLLLPGDFLGIAKLKGLLLKIDEFVLKQTLSQIPHWNENNEKPVYVSVNLTSAHFLLGSNLEKLLVTLKAHPEYLKFLRIDISEEVLLEEKGLESLKIIDKLNIGLNLDDFGIDSDSLHYLSSFPFNSLKIDRALIGQMENEINAELIVAVLRIAKRMGMKTIAEGVITHAQLEELRGLGCSEAQGFLFSKAVTASEASELLQVESRW